MEFVNIKKSLEKLDNCDVETFDNPTNSFKYFCSELNVSLFRHIKNVKITFDHPVTVLAGTNKIGKTSLLILLACSYEKFKRLDASKPEPTWREHSWKDMVTFTRHETEKNNYTYSMKWRVGKKTSSGEGKRLASSKSWSGLGKKSNEARQNARIKEREVRLIELDRLLPARSFSASLLRKSSQAAMKKLDEGISKAFCYILEIPPEQDVQIFEVGGHVNKRCYLIKSKAHDYSSYGAASGEEALINLLRDILDAPEGSLILIDEIEAGFHPTIQRRLVNVICHIAWAQKKQFILTSHSATIIDELPVKSRKFIERHNAQYKTISGLAPQAALSKMDSVGHPLVRLFCEDRLAKLLIEKIALEVSSENKNFAWNFEIIMSGPADMVRNDYERHKLFFDQLRNKIGYCAVFDGDCRIQPQFRDLIENDPLVYAFNSQWAPEVMLGRSYLNIYPNTELQAFLSYDNHHAFFKKMVELNLAANENDALHMCYFAFTRSEDFEDHKNGMRKFLLDTYDFFSELGKR